ncbi:Pc16g03740 [Penicillium rubens Wisconsin 54-1255]|uniref:Pc16g03740 protein n=1 Tax=Penicillium rubens (strain ATCC 28089 / DSM 1075 / NRRL 1951 / Wisconsin 54-1255) TaxID=500485 RepID=B6H7T8_PENRW|nr:Pc16g03740 [Penicillium rubens Wisconsin 54-1255]
MQMSAISTGINNAGSLLGYHYIPGGAEECDGCPAYNNQICKSAAAGAAPIQSPWGPIISSRRTLYLSHIVRIDSTEKATGTIRYRSSYLANRSPTALIEAKSQKEGY